jgi:hypothetical protein
VASVKIGILSGCYYFIMIKYLKIYFIKKIIDNKLKIETLKFNLKIELIDLLMLLYLIQFTFFSFS